MSGQAGNWKIYFPQYKRGKVGIRLFDGTVLDHAMKLDIPIASECNGAGSCGKCKVRIERGTEALGPLTAFEKEVALGPNERLACQATVIGGADLHVFVRNVGHYSILSEAVRRDIKLDPFVVARDSAVYWRGPAGEERLGDYTGHIYGLAVDVGTTTIVSQVLDLESGDEVATVAIKNRQAAYGEDVISRISHVMYHDNGLSEVRGAVIDGINVTIERAAEEAGINPEHIYEATAVGNSTMQSILFGMDPTPLGVIPFEAPSKEPIVLPAGEMGLHINPRARVYGAPLIGGHAGADCLADILACGMYEAERVSILIDIGTNGEVAIGNKDKIMTASCAAGGAYEGGTVSSGVGAIEGAIKNVRLENGQPSYDTIGDKPPIGICGSGLIDLLAELLESGIMTKNAKLAQDFTVTDGIAITQQDVYQLITAKAGLRLDQDLLIQYYGTTLDEIDRLYLAGGFGNFITSENAIAIGLLPNAPDKVTKIGNAALSGAVEMLLSRQCRADAERLAYQIEHVKPNEREPDFPYMVAEKMYF